MGSECFVVRESGHTGRVENERGCVHACAFSGLARMPNVFISSREHLSGKEGKNPLNALQSHRSSRRSKEEVSPDLPMFLARAGQESAQGRGPGAGWSPVGKVKVLERNRGTEEPFLMDSKSPLGSVHLVWFFKGLI